MSRGANYKRSAGTINPLKALNDAIDGLYILDGRRDDNLCAETAEILDKIRYEEYGEGINWDEIAERIVKE